MENKFKNFGSKIDSSSIELILGKKYMMKEVEKSLWWKARIKDVNKKDGEARLWTRFEFDPDRFDADKGYEVKSFDCDLNFGEFENNCMDECHSLCMKLEAFFKPFEGKPIRLERLKEMVRDYIRNVWNKHGFYLDGDDFAVFRWMISYYDLIITASLDSDLNIKDMDVYAEDERFRNKVIYQLAEIGKFCIHQPYRTLPSFLDKLFSSGWFDEVLSELDKV